MNGERIKLARRRAGLSLRGLADKMNNPVTAQAIGKYERDEMTPSSEVLIALTKTLDVSLSYLMAPDSIELGEVEFRTKDAPGRVLRGTIQRVSAAGTRDPDEVFREHLEMADFSMDPRTGLTTRNLFEIVVTLDELPGDPPPRGMTGHLRLIGMSEPVGKTLLRKVLLFVSRVSD